MFNGTVFALRFDFIVSQYAVYYPDFHAEYSTGCCFHYIGC